MALTVDEIAEMLNKMRVENNNNVKNFENALTNIYSKLELMAENSEATDLIKVYLTELRNIVDGRFASANEKLDVLENVVTEANFSDFRKDLADFVQKIIDNDASLNAELSFNNEKIEHILTNLNSFDCAHDEVSGKLDELKALYDEKSVENCANIINDIKELREELVKADLKLNFDGLNVAIANVISEVNDIKNEMLEKHDNVSEDVSTAFASVKLSLENIVSATNSLNDSVKNEANKSAETILANIDELCGKIDELKADLDETTELASTSSEKILEEITSGSSDFRLTINGAVESLKKYIEELNSATNEENLVFSDKVTEKLSGMETAIINSSMAYEEKITEFQDKLTEFAQNAEKISSSTDEKISTSMDEIDEIKNEVFSMHEALSEIKVSADEKSQKVLSLIDEELKAIGASFEELKQSAVKEVDLKINENLDLIENRFTVVLDAIEGIKSETGLADDLEEKFSALKQEIRLVNTDITDLIGSHNDEIVKAFDPIKDSLDSLSGTRFNKVIEELKTIVETSFMNFSVDVNGELASNSEVMIKLEQAYKEIFNRISLIEECVTEKIQNDIELLNVTVETSAQNLQSEFEEKLDYYINDLKKQLLEDSRTTDLIENTKEELSGKLDSILDSQSNITEQANVISAKIATFGDELKNYVQSACENVIDNESKEVLNSLGDIVAKADELNLNLEDKIKSNSEEVKSSLEDVVAKADKISLNLELNSSDLKSSLEDIVAKADELNSNLEDKIKLNGEELKNSLDVLSNKVDIMASDTSFDDLYERFEDFSETEDKLSEMISALHQKVDAIAMDETTFDIEEEIDDIKELIFEQRKYFEASSDDKASAIDKYLNDVLLKLDNVDLEKNAEDIKETIMNALVSLVDQISFVEETEEIKDFVEEKTDAINQSLIEVQNQLRQIANSDDDFAYSYTLQDVESDIAKLRLAISHLSGNDFESLSDDIKKIVSSVEGLESTLTQEQAVDLKSDIEKLNEDILSISSRTNKLLLTSDESYKNLNDGLNNFTNLVYNLEDRINYLDNSATNERLEKKIENIQSMAKESANADKVFHQVMMYLGEWIDSSSESISDITEKISKVDEKTSEIEQVKTNIEELRNILPEKDEILSQLEEKFEQQETRIDRLEMKIEKILSTLEEKDDMVLNRKVDKIEKMLSRLGTNIEKLTSYVDED